MRNAHSKFTPRRGAVFGRLGTIPGAGRSPNSSMMMPQLTSDNFLKRVSAEEQSSSEADSCILKQELRDRPSDKMILKHIGLLNQSTEPKNQQLESCKDQSFYEQEYAGALQGEIQRFDSQLKAVLEVKEVSPVDQLQRLPEGTVWEYLLKHIRLFLMKVSFCCQLLVQNKLFQALSLMVILANTVIMILADPLSRQPSLLQDSLEQFFLSFYILEMLIKVFSSGFVMGSDAYLRNSWNLLDFIVVVTSVIPLMAANIGFNITSLKAIRVLRPLRAITKFNSLKMIVKTLFAAMPLVFDSIMLLLLVIIAFSVLGMQLFNNQLNKYCINAMTGVVTNQLCTNDMGCTTNNAGADMKCALTYFSPNFSFETFHGFGWSLVNVFQIITMEGWSTIMYDLEQASGPIVFFFCLGLIMACSMTLLNITLAILKNKFSQQKKHPNIVEAPTSSQFEIETLKRLGLFANISKLSSIIHKRIEVQYGAGIERKMMELQKKRVVQRTKHRYGIKGSRLHMPMGRPSELVIPKPSLGNSSHFEDQSVREQDSQPFFEGIRTTKSVRSIKSMKNIRSINRLPSAKVLKIVEYPINDVIYESGLLENKEQGQPQPEELDDESQSSVEEIDTDKAIEEGQHYDFQHINAVERNKYIFQLLRILKQQQTEQVNGITTLIKSLETPKLVKNGNSMQQNTVQTQKIAYPEPKPALMKKASTRSNQPGDATQLRDAKTKVENKQTLMEMKHQQEMAIEDMKIINEVKSKELVVDLNVANSQFGASYLLASERILERTMDNKPITSSEQAGLYRVCYRHRFEEDRKHWLEYRTLRIPQSTMVFAEGSGVANTFKEEPSQILESAQRLDEEKERTQRTRRLSQFRIHFKDVIAEQAVTPIDSIVDSSKLNEMCFQEPRQNELQISSHTGTEREIEQQDEEAEVVYEQLLVRESQKRRPNNEIYTTLVQCSAQSRTLAMRSPADDVLRECPALPEDWLHLSEQDYCVWVGGPAGVLNMIRNCVRKVVMHSFYDSIIFVLVLLNTFLLSLNGLVDTSNDPIDSMSLLNNFLTIAFLVDVVLKLLAYDLDFFEDYMNIFDLVVVVVGTVQLNQAGSSSFTALKTVRILKAIRVFRITRLIRGLNFMSVITNIILEVMGEFMQIFLLLSLFMLIYVLLGMQVFGGNSLPIQISGIRQNFNSFFQSLVTVFQVLTVENWNDIQTLIFLSSSSNATLIYLVTWIVIGNWVLLNLLQAILLDGFDAEQKVSRLPAIESSCLSRQTTEVASKSMPTQTTQPAKSTNHQPHQEESQSNGTGYSLFIFSPNNRFRLWCKWLTTHKYFDWAVVALILVSCGKLIYDSYDFQRTLASTILDHVVSGLFVLEFLLKVVHRGFIAGSGCYIQDGGNRLDFLMVLTSLADIFLDTDLSFIKILRVLRPLRMVSRNSKLKIITQCIGQSITGLANAGLLLFLVYFIFGVFFVNLLQGKLNYCDTGVGPVYGPYNTPQNVCLQKGGTWRSQQINFDNVYRALLSLYIFSTRENWPYYYYTFVDADDQGPVLNNNPVLFFVMTVIVIFVCSYFMLDLFVGVLFVNYRMAEARHNPRKLTPKQQSWVALQQFIARKDLHLQLHIEPANPLRKLAWRVVTSKGHLWSAAIVTVLNVIFYAAFSLDSYDSSNRRVLRGLSHLLQLFYTLELIFKLVAYSPKGYLFTVQNIVDLVVILVDLSNIPVKSPALFVVVVIGRILRAIFLLRLLRNFKSLQKLIDTVLSALPSLVNVLAALGLFLFVFAVLAAYLFGSLVSDPYGYISSTRNFSNFHQSFQLIFVCLTGQNWYYYMFATMHPESRCIDPLTQAVSYCGSPLYVIYWLPFIFVGQKIVMELFVLVVLEQFEKSYIHQTNPIGLFDVLKEDFIEKWIRCCKKDPTKQTITPAELVELCLVLKPPLGLGKDQTLREMKDQLSKGSDPEVEDTKKLYEFLSRQRSSAVRWVRSLRLPNRQLEYHRVFFSFAEKSLKDEAVQPTSEQLKLIQEAEMESQQHLSGYQRNLSIHRSSVQTNTNPLVAKLLNQIVVNAWCQYSLTKHRRLHQRTKCQADLFLQQDSVLFSDVDDSDQQDIRFIELRDQKRANLDKRCRNSRTSRSSRLETSGRHEPIIPNTDIYSTFRTRN